MIKIPSWIWLALVPVIIFARLAYWQWVSPTALNQDEAAIVWNGHLLLNTGKDEWGDPLGFTYQSFGDWKLTSSALVFGLFYQISHSPYIAARLPIIIAMSFLPYLLYLYGKRIFKVSVGHIAAVLSLASPWTWHYGTSGFEASLALVLFLAAGLLLVDQKLIYKIIGFFVLTISLFTYNAPLLTLPVLWLLWAWWVKKEEKSYKKLIFPVLSSLLAAIVVFFLVLDASTAKQGIALWSDQNTIAAYPLYRQRFKGLFQTAFGNRYVYYALRILDNYFGSFSLRFLVWHGGDNPWHTLPGLGHLPLPVWIAAWGGFVGMIINSGKKNGKWLLLLMMLVIVLSFGPASITVDAPHATRSLLAFAMITLLSAFGLNYVLKTKGGGLVVALLVLGSFYWLPSARTQWQKLASSRWNIGLGEAIIETMSNTDNQVTVVSQEGLLGPHIGLFTNMSPNKWQESVRRGGFDASGLAPYVIIDKYYFKPFINDKIPGSSVIAPNDQGKWSRMAS